MRIKRGFALIIVFMFVVFSFAPTFINANYQAFANEKFPGKEEVVYAILNGDGSVGEVYVVNIFEKTGEIIDYGDYSAVRNMTTEDKIELEDNMISVMNTADKLYYEGSMVNCEIPWNIGVKYYMDGEEYTAEEIGGKSGALRIEMNIAKNSNCSDWFYKNYAIQASITLDTNQAKNIIADSGTIVNVGSDKQITFTILPDKGAALVVTADVKKFEMTAIEINGIRLNLNIEIDDAELMEKIDELIEGVVKIDDGANDLNDGVIEIKDGSDKLVGGAIELKNGVLDMDKGIDSLREGVGLIDEGLGKLNKKSTPLITASSQMKTALISLKEKLKSGLELLKNNVGYEQYKAAMNPSGSATGIDIDALKTLNGNTIALLVAKIEPLKATYELMDKTTTPALELDSQIKELEGIVNILKGNYAAMAGTEAYLNGVSDSILVFTSSSALGVDTLVDKYSELDKGINEYVEGVDKIGSKYNKIISGVSDLRFGNKDLMEGSEDLYEGAKELLNGSADLYRGSLDLIEGTGKLKDETSKMPLEVRKEIDEMIAGINGDVSQTKSFVSNKNKEVQSVQFVMKTKEIEGKKSNKIEEKPIGELTFWQKILNLFGANI